MVRVRIGDELHELSWDEWESRVRAGRIPDDARVQFDAVTGGEFVRAGDLEMYRSLRNDAAIAFQGRFFSGPPPVLTALLVGFQIRVWWFARLPRVQSDLVAWFTNWTPPTLEDGEVWRPLTMGLLHTEAEHLVLNMMWLAYTGWNVERALGRANLALLYFASVLGGAVLSMFGSPETPSLGASGGVFGLVAASVVFGFVRPELLPVRGRRLFGVAMLPYLVVMFWSGLMNEQTDNWSHFGGLLTGGLLALLLDPEGLERRARWNSRVRGAVLGVGAALLVGLYALGPRVEILVDSEVARARATPRRAGAPALPPNESYRALEYRVPLGWRPGFGELQGPAFVSPASEGGRAFGVGVRAAEHLQSLDALTDQFIARLQEQDPAATIDPPIDETVVGLPGRRVVAHPSESASTLEWRAAVRGTWALEEIWQVEDAASARLAPLRDRMRASVKWSDPDELVQARADVASLPQSAKARARLAAALVRVGEVDEAMALHDALLAESPNDPDRWIGLLETLRIAGDRAPDAERRWAEALATSPSPKVVSAVAGCLEAAGREADAKGLLRVAWDRAPGDAALRRALRRRGMSTELDPATGGPWDLAYQPWNGEPRPPEEVAARIAAPLDLDAAATAGRTLTLEHLATIRVASTAIAVGDPNGRWPLHVLKDGAIPPDGSDALLALVDDLRRAAGGARVPWIPDPVAEALAAHPDYPDRLVAVGG